MSADGTRVTGPSRIVYDGHEDQPTIEGTKFYKRNGYYYIMHAEGGTGPEHSVMIARSKEDKHAVGLVAFNENTPREGFEISWLVRYEDHNKGYCTEMVKAMMEYLRKEKGATKFWAECADENIASCQVMKKLGMTPIEKSSYSKRDGSRTFESTVYATV